MKTTIVLLSALLFLGSCEMTPEQREKDFKKKAVSYMNGRIDSDKNKEFIAAEITEVKELIVLTPKALDQAKQLALAELMLKKLRYYKDLYEIDQEFNYQSQVTISAGKDYKQASNALKSFESKMSLDGTTNIGWSMLATVAMHKSDGSRLSIPIVFYYDKEGYIDAGIMESIYGK